MTERTAVTAYPLTWPSGWPRTKPEHQRQSLFGRQYGSRLTVYSACQDVLAELDRLGAPHLAISTNLRVRNDGIPYSNQREPADAGAAVWFDLPDEHGELREHVLACDRWWTVKENLRAIAKHIAALRGIDRWGVGSIEQAFRGFQALPEQAAGEPWWQVLACAPDADEESIGRAFRIAAKGAHPDAGGEPDRWHAICGARQQGIDAARQRPADG